MSSTAPQGRTPPATIASTLGGAVNAVLSNFGAIVLVIAVYAAVTSSVDYTLYGMLGPKDGAQPDQSTLVRLLLGWEGAGLVMEILLGPIFAAVAVYTGKQWLAGEKVGVYAAVNFGLSRYGRMFVAHAAANILIRLGLLILVPGVLYMCQYAFVDSVAALESKKTWAMGRSKKLTRGRRRRIFMVLLPVLLVTQVMAFGDLWAIGQGGWALWLLHMGQHFMMMTMAIGFFLIYAERTTPKAGAAEQGTAQAE